VQASGGARDLDDVTGARAAGCAGIVLGKALLEGRFSIAEAVARLRAGEGVAC
jgi:phosphoribosylformimino-5-aminoimidazole carboxamide ribotide isomerase